MAVILNLEQGKAAPYPDLAGKMEQIAQRALDEYGLPASTEVSVLFCDDEMIRELNKSWRGVDTATDVLSFPQLEDEAGFSCPPGEELLLGDIVISLDRAAAQAHEFGHSLEREILYLFVHGLLHLLGCDHVEEEERRAMRRREEELLASAGVPR